MKQCFLCLIWKKCVTYIVLNVTKKEIKIIRLLYLKKQYEKEMLLKSKCTIRSTKEFKLLKEKEAKWLQDL